MVKPPINIGIISPRSYSTGGHDQSDLRISIRLFIKDILEDLIKQHANVTGITGIGLGTEQDFAEICQELLVDYIAVIPFDNMSSLWSSLPKDISERYNNLFEKAYQKLYLEDGEYSPKKIQNKYNKIIKECSHLICIPNKEIIHHLDSLKLPKSKTIFLFKH